MGNDQRCVLQAERLEKGSSSFAEADLARHLGHPARCVDAIAHDGDCLDNLGLARRRAASPVGRSSRHRERASLQIAPIAERVGGAIGGEQNDPWLQQIDARRCDRALAQRPQTELDRRARGECDDAACVLGYAHTGEPGFDAAAGRELDDGIFDLELNARHLIVEHALYRLDEERCRNGTDEQSRIQKPSRECYQWYDNSCDGQEAAGAAFGPAGCRARTRLDLGFGANHFSRHGNGWRRRHRRAVGIIARLAELAMHRRLPLPSGLGLRPLA